MRLTFAEASLATTASAADVLAIDTRLTQSEDDIGQLNTRTIDTRVAVIDAREIANANAERLT